MSCKIGRKTKVVLTASLLLNVFMASAIVGKMSQKHSGYDRLFDKAGVEQETRDVIRSAFKGKKDEIRAIMKETREKTLVLEEVISAPEFDVAAYDRAAFALQELGARVSMHRLATFREVLSELSQDERSKVAQMVSAKIMSKHHRKGRSKKGEDDGPEAQKSKE